MTTNHLAPFYAVILALAQPLILFAQENVRQRDWAVIQSTSAGSKLEIETKENKRIKGQLSQVSDTMVTVIHKNKPVSIDRENVQRVYILSEGSRTKNFLIGTGLGAGGGAGAALTLLGATGGSDESGAIIMIGVGIGAGIGAVIGALTGGSEKRTLIYEIR
jgi:hypothetical protein